MNKKFTYLHFIHAITIALLLVSGISLLFPTTRTWFVQLQFPLVTFHILTACLYIGIVLISIRPALIYRLHKPLLKKFNVWLTILFAVLWTSSGTAMYFQSQLPVSIRNAAVLIHDWSTFLFIPWALTHSIGHLFHIRVSWPNWWSRKAPLPEVLTENQLERRDIVKFLAISAAFVAFGGVIRWISPILSIPSDGVKRRGYFRIYNVTNDIPEYKENDWALTIDGLVENTATIKLTDVPRLPETVLTDDFHCVTGWSVRGVELKGVLLKDLFNELKINPVGKYVTAYSGDNVYFDSFTAEQLIEEGAMLMFQLDGQSLKNVHGFPCRLYHPSMYGYKSVKWLERLEFTNERVQGYWQQSGGYDLNGYL